MITQSLRQQRNGLGMAEAPAGFLSETGMQRRSDKGMKQKAMEG